MIFGWSDQISSTLSSHFSMMKFFGGWSDQIYSTFFSHFLRLIIMIIGGRSDPIFSTFCSHFSSTPSTPANQGRHPQGGYLICFLFCCLSLHYLHYGSKILQEGYSFAYQPHSSYFQLGLKHSLCLEKSSPLKKGIYKRSLFTVQCSLFTNLLLPFWLRLFDFWSHILPLLLLIPRSRLSLGWGRKCRRKQDFSTLTFMLFFAIRILPCFH